MYDKLVTELKNKLTPSEWELVSYYIYKADDLGKAGKESEAKTSLEDAVAVATADKEGYNAAQKIRYYLRFYW